MLFNSPVFLLFFAAVFLLCRLKLSWTGKKLVLLAASYIFYAAWNPPFVLLLWLSTIVDWIVARRIERSSSPKTRRGLLLVSLAVNLGVLGVFKYANFLSENFLLFAQSIGWQIELAPWSIVLPVGISFYTFQTLSYTIDVYRGSLRTSKSPLDFALFVTFFPQLVAGPIVRASEFLPQLDEPKRAQNHEIVWGAFLFVVGLFKKVFLADAVFAGVANKAYAEGGVPTAMEAWAGTYAFAGQIFCDFSGYSDMAIGCALALGFVLPDNFHAPYGAAGFSDLWRRWHISLSSWLRDYLYIPLGGNRKGRFRTSANLMLTMLLGGLWHGASWTFVAWGGLHGFYLSAERFLRRHFLAQWMVKSRLVRLAAILLTFHCVCLAWVLFRAVSFGQAVEFFRAMAGFVREGAGIGLPRFAAAVSTLCAAGLVCAHTLLRGQRLEHLARRVGPLATALAAAVMLFLVLTAGGGGSEFIYFQF